jgi:membrane-associated HD superfamily phosphohydrolase
MLSRRLDRVAAFTRRDAVRLAVAAALLITGLTAVLSIDDLPIAVNLQSGDLATADVLAPRTLVFQSAVETDAARQKARDDVPPQYDYKAESAAALTRRQLDALDAILAPVDAAFVAACPRNASCSPETLPASRSSAEDALPLLPTLDADRAEATRVWA